MVFPMAGKITATMIQTLVIKPPDSAAWGRYYVHIEVDQVGIIVAVALWGTYPMRIMAGITWRSFIYNMLFMVIKCSAFGNDIVTAMTSIAKCVCWRRLRCRIRSQILGFQYMVINRAMRASRCIGSVTGMAICAIENAGCCPWWNQAGHIWICTCSDYSMVRWIVRSKFQPDVVLHDLSVCRRGCHPRGCGVAAVA